MIFTKESPKKEVKEEAQTPKVLVASAGLPIKRAMLHQPFTVAGSTETNISETKGYTMIYHPDGLYCEYKTTKFIIPIANVIVLFP